MPLPLGLVALVVAVWVASWPAATAAQQAGSTLLDRHDFQERTARFDLPGRLDEISGLAMTADGRLFGHDDERAVVHEIDPVSQAVGKRFSAGNPPVRGDFEGIAIVGERFFLVTSNGILYELREAGDREESTYRVTDTGLGAHCEIEGLDHDPVDDVLLFACKTTRPERDVLLIHRLPLDPTRARLPPIEVPRRRLVDHGLAARFAPSSIAVDPTGSLVLASAVTESLVEIDRAGRVLSGVRLSRSRHPQPEGLAFGPDGTLYVADERNDRAARITVYARVGTEVSER
jgi:uncharacterized protein YjiK